MLLHGEYWFWACIGYDAVREYVAIIAGCPDGGARTDAIS